MKHVLIALVALGLAACAGSTTATLSPAQCAADWAAVGAADGADGAPQGKLSNYRAACGRAGAPLSTAELDAWTAGWRRGLADFCAADPASLDDAARARQETRCATRLAAAMPDDPPEGTYAHHGHVHEHGEPAHDHYDAYHGPRIRPFFGLTIGSGGPRVGAGIGIGFGPFGIYHGY